MISAGRVISRPAGQPPRVRLAVEGERTPVLDQVAGELTLPGVEQRRYRCAVVEGRRQVRQLGRMSCAPDVSGNPSETGTVAGIELVRIGGGVAGERIRQRQLSAAADTCGQAGIGDDRTFEIGNRELVGLLRPRVVRQHGRRLRPERRVQVLQVVSLRLPDGAYGEGPAFIAIAADDQGDAGEVTALDRRLSARGQYRGAAGQRGRECGAPSSSVPLALFRRQLSTWPGTVQPREAA